MTVPDPASDLLVALHETLTRARDLRAAIGNDPDSAQRTQLEVDLRDTLSQLSTLLSEIDAMGGMDFLFAAPLGRA